MTPSNYLSSTFYTDINSVITKFGKKKLKKSTISAEQVKVTDGILVQGLEADTSRDMIELYFENQRKSGGGPVNEVEVNEEENTAFVSFEDWQSKYNTPQRHQNFYWIKKGGGNNIL